MSGTITVTKTDESPGLSSLSLMPVMAHFLAVADVELEQKDISFAGRILQEFSEYLEPDQVIPDDMDTLAYMVETPLANIIKLPNASATTNQLVKAVKELQAAGFKLPDYPELPRDEKERKIRSRYDALTGSVVNPVLRKGNAVRSIPPAVKEASRRDPHAMGEWKKESRTYVAHMEDDDFYATEQSSEITAGASGAMRVEYVGEDGSVKVLKSGLDVSEGDIVDAAVLKRQALKAFLADVFETSKRDDLLASLHLKATMMKKTDGIAFGEAVAAYFKTVFDAHEEEFDRLGVNPNNGLSDLRHKIQLLDDDERREIEEEIKDCLESGAPLAMANVKDDVTHLDAPNVVIMDVSMANLARWGGQLQDKGGQYRDTMAIIPDSTYARMHQSGIEYLKAHGTPDPATMGSVTTVRLQAGGAEEYGSKETTFEAPGKGLIRLVSENGDILHTHNVEKGDIWRLCRTKNEAIENWVKLALEQAAQHQDDVIFWLDDNRAHDAQVIRKVNALLGHNAPDTVVIMTPEAAIQKTLARTMAGKNTVAVTGNLIGDHVTDYFPIMEIASSSKMLSIIKLLNGGLVAETGSGGTAPDLLTMIAQKNHFLWDDVGTALAMAESLKHLSDTCRNVKARVLAEGLEGATRRYIEEKKSPSPDGYDNRESHFYLALYWAQEMARQTTDKDMQAHFAALAKTLEMQKGKILDELTSTKGKPSGLKGRYYPNPEEAEGVMRPSATLNKIFQP